MVFKAYFTGLKLQSDGKLYNKANAIEKGDEIKFTADTIGLPFTIRLNYELNLQTCN